jgi:hypothetical protein
MTKDQFSIDLTSESGRLEYATQLYQRYLEDLFHDAAMARVRLISGMQVALREAQKTGHIEPLVFYRPNDTTATQQQRPENGTRNKTSATELGAS